MRQEAQVWQAWQAQALVPMTQGVVSRTPGPLQQAVGAGAVELVRDLLAAGEDPNKLDETDHCAIRWAMAMIHIKRRPEDADAVRDVFACIELCLDAGALPDGPPSIKGAIRFQKSSSTASSPTGPTRATTFRQV